MWAKKQNHIFTIFVRETDKLVCMMSFRTERSVAKSLDDICFMFPRSFASLRMTDSIIYEEEKKYT